MRTEEKTIAGDVIGTPFLYMTDSEKPSRQHTIAFNLAEYGRFDNHSIVKILFDTDNVELAKNQIKCARSVAATGELIFCDIAGNAMLKANSLLCLTISGE